MQKLRIAVLFGGKSPEHEVSIITANQTIQAIDKERFDVVPIYVTKEGNWLFGSELNKLENFKDLTTLAGKAKEGYLLPSPNYREIKSPQANFKLFSKELTERVDVLFPCFHGGVGENGSFQGFAELLELPYVGSGVVGSATGFDKVIMKQLFSAHELPQVKYQWFFRSEWEQDATALLKKIETGLTYPLFVKPANAGSSVGVAKASNHTELRNAIEVAACYDRKIIVEESFENAREMNVSVLGNTGSKLDASVCEEVAGSNDFLTYSDKYEGGGKSQGMASTKRIVPAQIPASLSTKLQTLAKQAFSALDCSGVARIDFLVRDEDIRIIEINTIPGSLSFYLWKASGTDFTTLTTRLIELAQERRQEQNKNVTTFSTNILQNYSVGSTKGSKA